MADTRFRVVLLPPSSESSPPAPPKSNRSRSGSGLVASALPLSFWFIEREDAEMVAQLSAAGASGVALLAYRPGEPPRILRFLGTEAARLAFLTSPIARGEEPSLAEAEFFGSVPARDETPYRHAA